MKRMEETMNNLLRSFAAMLLGISISFIRATQSEEIEEKQDTEKQVDQKDLLPEDTEKQVDQKAFSLEEIKGLNVDNLFQLLKDQFSYTPNTLSGISFNSDIYKKRLLIIQYITFFSQYGLSSRTATYIVQMFASSGIAEVERFFRFLENLTQSNSKSSNMIDQEFIMNSDFQKKLISYFKNDTEDNLKQVMGAMYNATSTSNTRYPPIIRDFLSSFREEVADLIEKMLFNNLSLRNYNRKMIFENAKKYLGKTFFIAYMDLVIIKACMSLPKEKAKATIENLVKKFLPLIEETNSTGEVMYPELRKYYPNAAIKNPNTPSKS